MSHPTTPLRGAAGTPAETIKVVRGNPSDEEVAALVVALRMRQPAARKPEPVSGWTRREELLRRPLHPGPGAWRRGGQGGS